ncbi:MAG TPA: hypothetical protein VEW07_14745 [Solirubrobacterales bacterium]|nr:hypothetical protein [Solirubrobacterales bacterium]
MRSHAKAASAGSTEGNGSSRGLIRRGVAALAGTGSIALVLALFVAPAASAAPWGFEQVTPVDKGAGSVHYVDTFRTAPDGESFLYSAGAPFDSIPSESSPLYTRYIGHRGPDKWTSLSLDPPYEAGVGSGATFAIMGVLGSSTNLRYVVVHSTFALAPGATEGGGNIYLRDTRTRELTLIATSPYRALSSQLGNPMGAISIMYVDGEGKSVIFGTGVPLVEGAPSGTPPYFNDQSVSYKWTPGGGVEVIAVLPESEGGEAVAGWVGGYSSEDGPRNGIPATGGADHIYWRQASNSGGGGRLYVRSGDETKPVSYSRLPGESTVPLEAEIDAISRNGEYMVFHTKALIPLTADTPEPPLGEWGPATFAYRYDVSDGSLDYVGTTHAYGSAGVIQMTQDGQTIAFQSEIAQTEDAEEEKFNTYIWRDGELQLVASLDPGSTGNSLGGARQILSANGRYFTFTDNSKVLAEKFDQNDISSACPVGTDPGPCSAVYVYDTEAVGDPLQCASCRAPGVPPAGHAGDTLNNNSGTMRMDSRMTQSVANDGTVYFTTRDGLVAADQNKLEDVYAYNDGDLRLVSRASQASSRFLDATDDGKTVFFSTDDPIYPGDNDRAVDIYMTREGAGFPYTPPPVPPVCAGIESCHAGVPATPTQSSPGSSGFEGRGNEQPRTRTSGGKVTVIKPRPATGTNGALKVKAPSKGKLTVSGSGIKKATKSVSKAGTYTVKVTLTPQARKALEKSGQAQKKLKVTFKPSQGKASSATVKFTFKASAGKKGGRQS